MIGQILVLAGACLTLLAAVGMVRFDDVFVRLHSLSKASTLGVLMALIGAAVTLSNPNDITSLALAAVLQLVTSPVAANMISRATYLAEGIPVGLDADDERAHIADPISQDDPRPG